MILLLHFARASMAIALALVLQGCFSQAVSRVDRMVDEDGLGAMNIVAIVGDGKGMRLKSYGRLAGKALPDARVTRLLSTQETEWGELRVVAWEADAAAVAQTLGLEQDHGELAAVAAKSLGHSFHGFPMLSRRRTTINIYVAPYGSGRRVQAETPITADAVTATFIFGVDLVDRKTPITWWLSIFDGVAHELLHVEHGLSGKMEDSLNDETAAYLTGTCAQIWLTLDSGRHANMAIDVSRPFMQQAFPGLSAGHWAPSAGALSEFKGMNVSGIARSVAYAWIYHRYATEGSLDLSDRTRLMPLLEECQQFGKAVPRFLEAEASPAAR